jgi:hypothetical protein
MLKWKVGSFAAFVLLLLAARVPVTAALGNAESNGSTPQVLSPENNQKIGEGNDSLCLPAMKTCDRIRAQGRVPSGLHPYFAVEPVLRSPLTWIQPFVRGIAKDGTFSGLVHLGEAPHGAQEHFKIYVIACKTEPESFYDGRQIDIENDVPKDCVTSEPVEVFRVR